MRLLAAALLPPLALTLAAPAAPVQDLDRDKLNLTVQAGLRDFFEKTAEPDGSFRPGVDPAYRGMSDCAYSDLAAPTYAVVIHRTFGWKLPHEASTRTFFQARQAEDGTFFHEKGTANPKSLAARLYNTTQGLVALRALGEKPRYDPRKALDAVLRGDVKALPPYSTSFFPLAYRAAGHPYPKAADARIRPLMVQAEDGYMGNHIAATYHLVHYYRLLGEKTPRAERILQRVLADQKADGSWLINPPARDRHATFDAVFVLRHLGGDREDVKRAIEKAARWSMSCRNSDGGFSHYPGGTSDADAVYFHVGTLVMAGWLRPADPLPPDPQLLGWGHLMPRP